MCLKECQMWTTMVWTSSTQCHNHIISNQRQRWGNGMWCESMAFSHGPWRYHVLWDWLWGWQWEWSYELGWCPSDSLLLVMVMSRMQMQRGSAISLTVLDSDPRATTRQRHPRPSLCPIARITIQPIPTIPSNMQHGTIPMMNVSQCL